MCIRPTRSATADTEVGNSIFAPEAGDEIVKAAEKLLNGEE